MGVKIKIEMIITSLGKKSNKLLLLFVMFILRYQILDFKCEGQFQGEQKIYLIALCIELMESDAFICSYNASTNEPDISLRVASYHLLRN